MFKWFKNNTTVSTLEIQAPIQGTVKPLESVPDPAFAQKAMGDGVAIEPSEGKVLAPFDGEVTHMIDSKHAIILQHSTGVELLIHIGIDTVSLNGNGFTTHVKNGDKVKAGQLLIEFDMDQIREAGRPLISPIIVPDGQEIIERIELNLDGTTGSNIMKIHLK